MTSPRMTSPRMTSPRTSPRIASLLPSATEICFAIGLGDQVVGVSHECDFPAGASGRPVLTRSSIDSKASSSEIDHQVKQLLTEGLSLYDIEEDTLRELAPDVIVTQATCEVCAVSLSDVEAATCRLLGSEAHIVSLEPMGLDDVIEDHLRVGRAAGVEEHARQVGADLRRRLDALAARTADLERPRVLVLEWLDPPMVGGHWTPELIRIAGGEPVLGHHQQPTQATTWEAIAAAEPEVVLVAPCGFRMEQSLRELPAVFEDPDFQRLPAVASHRVVAIDGNAYFNRPGPRLVRSAELAALAIHPQAFGHEIEASADELRFDPVG
ncbi:MAG: cobalamin-binding protein [Acidobacteriota bacterium]